MMSENNELNQEKQKFSDYIKQISKIQENQIFTCRFIVLKNWRIPDRIPGIQDIEPYYEEIFGLQIQNKLYYLNELGEISYVFINKPKNEIIYVYEEIPENTPDSLVTMYLKKGKQLKILEIQAQKSKMYYNKQSK